MNTTLLNLERGIPAIAVACGGDNPGVFFFSRDGSARLDAGQTPPVASAYTCAFNRANGRFAVADRSGRVSVFSSICGGRESMGVPIHLEVFPAPALNLVWLDDHEIAVSDAANAVWVLDLDADDAVRIHAGDAAVVGLVSRSNSELVGLTEKGEFLRWTRPFETVRCLGNGPAPPERGALVRLLATSDKGPPEFIYPSDNGELVSWSSDSVYTVRRLFGAPFYALAACGGQIVAFGHKEGKCLLWKRGLNESPVVLEAPSEAVSVSFGPWTNDSFVLAFEDGSSGIFSVSGSRLSLTGSLNSSGVRVVTTVDPEFYSRERHRRQEIRLQELQRKATEALTVEDAEEFDLVVLELLDIGKPNEALSWLIKGGRRGVPAAASLRRLVEGEAALRNGTCGDAIADQFVHWLGRNGLVDEAVSVARHRPEESSAYGMGETLRCALASMTRDQEDSVRVIVDPSPSSLEETIALWTALDRPLEGSFVIRRFDVVGHIGQRLNREAFFSKVALVLPKPMDNEIPNSVRQEVLIIDESSADLVESLRLPLDDGSNSYDVSLWVTPHQTRWTVYLRCRVVLVFGAADGSLSPSRHNQFCRARADEQLRRKAVGASVDAIRRRVLEPVLWRLNNEQKSRE